MYCRDCLLSGLLQEMMNLPILLVDCVDDRCLHQQIITTLLFSLVRLYFNLFKFQLVRKYVSLISQYFGFVLVRLWAYVCSQMQAAQSSTKQPAALILMYTSSAIVGYELCGVHFAFYCIFFHRRIYYIYYIEDILHYSHTLVFWIYLLENIPIHIKQSKMFQQVMVYYKYVELL